MSNTRSLTQLLNTQLSPQTEKKRNPLFFFYKSDSLYTINGTHAKKLQWLSEKNIHNLTIWGLLIE